MQHEKNYEAVRFILNQKRFFSEQAEARRIKNKESRKRREERQAVKRAEALRIISESEKDVKIG